jgi:hypothetical protein
MILDERLEFADAVSVAAAAGSAVLGDVIDLGSPVRDIGNGEQLFLVITVDTEVITGGVAGTLQFKLKSNATADLAGTPTEHYASPAFVTDDAGANDAELNAGGVPVAVAIPMEGKPYQRYLVVERIIGTTTITAGAVSAFLTHDVSKWKSYPNAVGA